MVAIPRISSWLNPGAHPPGVLRLGQPGAGSISHDHSQVLSQRRTALGEFQRPIDSDCAYAGSGGRGYPSLISPTNTYSFFRPASGCETSLGRPRQAATGYLSSRGYTAR